MDSGAELSVDPRMSWFEKDRYASHPDFKKFRTYVPEFDFDRLEDPDVKRSNIELLKKKSSMYKEIICNKGGWLFPQKIYLSDMNFITRAEEQIKVLDSFLSNQRMARSLYTRFRYISDELLPGMIREKQRGKQAVRLVSFGSGTGIDVMEALVQFDHNVTADLIESDKEAVRIGKIIADKMGLKDRVRFYEGNLTKHPIENEYDIGLMIGIICPLPDDAAVKVISKVKKNMAEEGTIIVSSSGKLMGDEDPLNRFLAEYTTDWFLNFRTDARMKRIGRKAGLRNIRVDAEPMDYNKLLIGEKG